MEEKNFHKVALIIMDGWGDGDGSKADVISVTPTPVLDGYRAKYPHAELLTSGENVGLPDGQMGNSEVGHLNIGAGRIVYQDLARINKEIETGAIDTNPVLLRAFEYAKEKGKSVHFMGLVSDGGVHALDKHLYKLCDMAQQHEIENVFIHAFTDGRDTDPKSGLGFIEQLEEHIAEENAELVSVIGRYYAMDRDKRWARVKIAYDMLVKGDGTHTTSMVEAIAESYEKDQTDEFILPIVKVDEKGDPIGRIEADDVVICFNFRTDRLRELTIVLTQQDMPEFGMKTIPLHYVTFTRYDETFKHVEVVYDKENLHDTLGETLEKVGATQLRIAETEKYAHVTFFFSGGREEPFKGEHRILVPSPKVSTYDLQPEMSANEVTEKLLADIKEQTPDFICLNFANGDMVGHTGVYAAIEKAVQTVDHCVGEVVECARAHGYDCILIADHGNADHALNEDGSPNTAHSLNPVPIIVVTDRFKKVGNGRLCDVAPTILQLMGIKQPDAMTGKALCSDPL